MQGQVAWIVSIWQALYSALHIACQIEEYMMPKNTVPKVEFAAPLWLNKNRKAFLQGRRIELLEKIEEHGSISKASKVAGMSYKGPGMQSTV